MGTAESFPRAPSSPMQVLVIDLRAQCKEYLW